MAANPKVAQEIWASYIVEKLWKTNPHLNLCYDESEHVKGGSIVYIPQAGAKPNVVKNRSQRPAEAVQRNDSAIFYPLDDFSTDPTTITWAENMEISYGKTDSVLGDHTNVLSEVAGDEILYSWVKGYKPTAGGGMTVEYIPTKNQLFTSGGAAAVNDEDGQTGQRLAFTYKDLQSAQAKMNKAKVSKEGRYAMVESNMLQQLIDSLSSNQMAAFQASADLKNGIIGRFAGFDILERSSVLAFDGTNKPIVPGQALAATDNLGVLCWQKDSVTKALGDKELFQRVGDPQYYGDLYSCIVKLGGRCRREDWAGILSIVQKTA